MAYDEQDYVDGWATYNDWLDNIREDSQIIKRLDEDLEFRKNLSNCRNNLERFNLIWTNEPLKKEIKNIHEQDSKIFTAKIKTRAPKTAQESKRLRELGNKSFKDADYYTALNYYTQAIRFAPTKHSNQQQSAESSKTESNVDTQDDSLPLALANRSAALYAMNRFRLCMNDIDLAIKYGYPQANMFKLHIRKLKCLHILSVWANDDEQIKEDLQMKLKDYSTKDFIKVEIQNMFDFLKNTKPEDVVIDELDVVDEIAMRLSNGAKRIPHCADCVEMSYVDDKGRFLIVNKDCSIGRLVLAEEPFACNLAPSKRNEYCYACLGRLHNCGLSCQDCTQIFYCSLECLESNHLIHRYECNAFLDFQDKLGVAYIAAHLMFKIDFGIHKKYPMTTKKNTDHKTIEEILKFELNDWPEYIYRGDYVSVLSLNDHASDYDHEEMTGHLITASYLVVGLMDLLAKRNPELLENSLKTTDQQVALGSVILRHLLQLQTNLISILDQNLQNAVARGHEISGFDERPIGVGIYPTIALMNHSCRPNIMSIFHRNKFVARATQVLPCGTEVKYCYGPSVSRMSKRDRQRRLKEQYFFDCACECCSEDQEDESRALVCPKCQGPVIYNQDITHGCLKCHSTDSIDIKLRLREMEELRNKVENLKVSDVAPAQKIETLTNIEEKLRKLAFWKHPDFAAIKSCMSEFAQEMEDIKAATKYSEEELELCNRTYGIDSYVSIMTMLKVVNLRWQGLYDTIESENDTEKKREGIEALKKLSATVVDTRGKLRDMLSATNIKGADSSYETEIGFLNTIQKSINNYIRTVEEEIDPSKVRVDKKIEETSTAFIPSK